MRAYRSLIGVSVVTVSLAVLGCGKYAHLKEAAKSESRGAYKTALSAPHAGLGPGVSGDRYARIPENSFLEVAQAPRSTFSIDVDTAAYANARRFLLEEGVLPPPGAVRIEELVNYFAYDDPPPQGEEPFAASLEMASCPWHQEHHLVRIGLKGRVVERAQRPAGNLVFLLDVSGSMDEPDKLPLVKRAVATLAQQLTDRDRVSIVVYAGAAGMVLPPTSGRERSLILQAIDRLEAGGSTAGGAGIELAYRTAQQNYIDGGVNRVILCTDGDFNVGVTSDAELVRLAKTKAASGVYLTVLGFGRGNLNDQMMEQISNRGNGNYAYIDSDREARRVLGEQISGTLVTIAEDVKIQVEFNPALVAAYRLIGYENRLLRDEDFNDEAQDAGEIGAGHSVTALYEIVPVGESADIATVDPLKYQTSRTQSPQAETGELLTLEIRYKEPAAAQSKLLTFVLPDDPGPFAQASADFKFAAAVASFGMLLRDSEYRGNATWDSVLENAAEGVGNDPGGYRAELLEMIRRARQIARRQEQSTR